MTPSITDQLMPVEAQEAALKRQMASVPRDHWRSYIRDFGPSEVADTIENIAGGLAFDWPDALRQPLAMAQRLGLMRLN